MARFKKGEKHKHNFETHKSKRRSKAVQGASLVKPLSCFVFVFAFLLYSNTLSHDYALDDDVVFLKNKYVQDGIAGIKDIFSHGFLYGFNQRNNQSYRPLVSTVFALEHEYFGNKPATGHLLNVLLYAISCVLLFLMLTKVFRNYVLLIPLLIALLYTAHPIHTEVVANIKGRDDMLTFFFMVLSFNLLFYFLEQRKVKILFASALAYFACLLTKENAITIIATIPILVFVFSDVNFKRALRITIPFAFVVVVYLLIRNAVLDTVGFGETLDVINNSLMAAETKSDMFATNFVIIGKYLALLVFPHPLSFDYSFNQFPIVGWGNLRALGSLLIYIVLGVYAGLRIKKKDPIAFGILFYLITFSITSNLFIKIGCTLGERFMFIPSLGFCVVLVFMIARVIKFIPINNAAGQINLFPNSKSRILTATIMLVLLGYSFKTYSRNFDWKNNQTLFEADVKACPNSARTHFSLASTLNTNSSLEKDPTVKSQMLANAIKGFHKTVKIHPEFGSAWYNMGVAYYSMGDQKNALHAYQNCLIYNPYDKMALNNVGVIYFNRNTRNDLDTALSYFNAAVKSNPNFGDPYANIGAVYHNLGQKDNALKYYEKALQFNPGNKMVMGNMIKLYNSIGDVEKANYYAKRSGQ